MTRDPHKILGVTPGASHDEIRRAYLRMVKKYHPDVGGDAWVFSEIQAAYEALTGKKQSTPQEPQSGKPSSNPQPPDPTPASADRKRARPDSAQAVPPRPEAPQAAPRNAEAERTAGRAVDEFSFSPLGAGRRPRRRRSTAGSVFGVALGGAMALALGWYVVQTRPDLVGLLSGGGSIAEESQGSAPQTLPTSTPATPAATQALPPNRSPPPSGGSAGPPGQPLRKGSGSAPNSSAPRQPEQPSFTADDQRRSAADAARGSAPRQSLADSSPTPPSSASDSAERPFLSPSAAGDPSSLPRPAASETAPVNPEQPTGLQGLDADIVDFDRRLAQARREPTELKREVELEESIEWMRKNCKRSRVRIDFQISDIRRGDGTVYLVQLGTPDPGEYPRIMSYPKIAEMNLDEDEALRLGDQYRLSVEGFTGFQWGPLDPSKAIVFYASECPLAPLQPGAPYGPNFGVFPTDYVFLGKDSLHPAYWIILADAKLRIVRAKD